MMPNKTLRRFLFCAATAFFAAAIPGLAQATDSSSRREVGPTVDNAKPPFPKEVANENKDDDVYVLSPFSVQGDEVVGYQAKTTLASTRLRTKVDDVGTALQIVTAQFLKDTGATDNNSLLIYTTGTG